MSASKLLKMDSDVVRYNMLGKSEVVVSVCDYKITEIENPEDIEWFKLVGLTAVYALVDEGGEEVYKQVMRTTKMGNKILLMLGGTFSLDAVLPASRNIFSSMRGYDLVDVKKLVVTYDYKNKCDFVRITENADGWSTFCMYIRLVETNEVLPVTSLSSSQVYYKGGRFSYWDKKKFELLYFVGWANMLYRPESATDCIGRFFIMQDIFTDGTAVHKCIRLASENRVEYEDYDFVGEVFKKTREKDMVCVTGNDNCFWLNVCDYELQAKGNRDSEGNVIIEPVKRKEGDNSNICHLEVNEDSVIVSKDNVCINSTGYEGVIIKSNNNSRLTLEAGSQQPCIGLPTYTGMSYGRWSPASIKCSLKKIIVDNVRLVLKSKVSNFSVGAYNYEEYPEVILINGATIEGCPEVDGKRLLTHKAKAPEGSTKISDTPEYIIVKDGVQLSSDELLAPQVKLYKELLTRVDSKYAELVSVYSNPDLLREAVNLTKMKPDLDVSLLLSDSRNFKRNCIAVGTVVLGMKEAYADMPEITYEIEKVQFLKDKYSELLDNTIDGAELQLADIARKIYQNKDFNTLSDWDKKYIYEMIPSYQFDFDNYATEEENAKRFYNLK